jgi:hypothetical protein
MHAMSVSVRLLENASSQHVIRLYFIDTPKKQRYTEDTQLKIHLSPSSAPDLRIALSASPLLTRTTASTSTQWQRNSATHTQALCVAIERKPHHQSLQFKRSGRLNCRTSAGHMALSDYHTCTAGAHTLKGSTK